MSKEPVTGPDYWRRTLRLYTDPETDLVVGFSRDDRVRLWSGRLVSLDDPSGLLVDVRGETRRLCPWDAIRSVETTGGAPLESVALVREEERRTVAVAEVPT